MDGASLVLCLLQVFSHLSHRECIGHTALSGHVGNAIYAAKPYNVLDVYVVTYQIFTIVVYVYDTGQAFAVLTEVVQERAVLTESVCIRGIVGRRIVVACQQNNA